MAASLQFSFSISRVSLQPSLSCRHNSTGRVSCDIHPVHAGAKASHVHVHAAWRNVLHRKGWPRHAPQERTSVQPLIKGWSRPSLQQTVTDVRQCRRPTDAAVSMAVRDAYSATVRFGSGACRRRQSNHTCWRQPCINAGHTVLRAGLLHGNVCVGGQRSEAAQRLHTARRNR